MNRRKRGILLLTIAAFMICGALSVIGNTYRLDKKSRSEAASTIAQIQALLPQTPSGSEGLPGSGGNSDLVSVAIGENSYIGILSIPSLDLTLPVLSGEQSGSGEAMPYHYTADFGNFLIYGQNYKSQLGKLSSLKTGDSVTFTDVGNNVYTYTVTSLASADKNSLESAAGTDSDLVLFTNKTGGAYVVADCVSAD